MTRYQVGVVARRIADACMAIGAGGALIAALVTGNGCAHVRYQEHADGKRDFSSWSLGKDIEAQATVPGEHGPATLTVGSSSKEATHATATLGATAIGALAGAAVSGGPGAGVGAAAGGGIAEVWQQVQDWLRSQQDAPATAATNAPAAKPVQDTPAANPEPSAAAVWPAYDGGDFYQHGRDGEDDYRRRIIAETRAAGLDCIRVTLGAPPPGPPYDLAAHLFWWRSDVDGQYKCGSQNWAEQMRAAGIPKTQWDASAILDNPDWRARWKYYAKDWGADRLQVVSGGKVITL